MKAFRPGRKPARRRPFQCPRLARLGIELLEERLAPSSSPLAIPLADDPDAGLLAADGEVEDYTVTLQRGTLVTEFDLIGSDVDNTSGVSGATTSGTELSWAKAGISWLQSSDTLLGAVQVVVMGMGPSPDYLPVNDFSNHYVNVDIWQGDFEYWSQVNPETQKPRAYYDGEIAHILLGQAPRNEQPWGPTSPAGYQEYLWTLDLSSYGISLRTGCQYILSINTVGYIAIDGNVYMVSSKLDDGSPADMYACPIAGYPPQELPFAGYSETQWAAKISVFVPTDTVGPDKVGVHRNQMWYLDADGSQGWNVPGDDYFSFGISTDEPIVGDWDGDGYDEVGVHRGDMWYLDYDGNGQWNFPGDQYSRFGIVGDEPVVGDWDGDGNDEVGVHRGDWWYLDADGSHAWSAGDEYFRFGISGDEPLVGDWNGDGIDEVGVHRGDAWYLDADGSGAWNASGDVYFCFGISGDDPLVGDWNADGADEVGVRRGNAWYLDTDGSRGWNVPGDEYFRFGIASDQPIVGHWQSAGGGGGGQSGGGSGSQSGGGGSFASVSSVLAAEPETALMAGLFSTNTSVATIATQIDSVFTAEPAALPSAAESDTELPMDAISGQVTRSNRLGWGGLLDLPITKVHDQALEELLQSVWWLPPNRL